MRWDVFAWAAVALLLFAAEAMAPGAFMLWLGLAAVAVFLAVLLVPGIPLLVQAAAFVIAIGLTVAIWLLLLHTRVGRGIRASAQNRVAARLYGVSPKRIYALTFGIGSALAGVAGGLYGLVSQINPYIGGPLTAKSFVIAIIGGLDNPLGVIVGGLALGVIEALTSLYVGPTYRDVASFGILVLVLIVRPTGLLGRAA